MPADGLELLRHPDLGTKGLHAVLLQSHHVCSSRDMPKSSDIATLIDMAISRLGLKQQKFVKWTAIACVFAYCGVMGAIWGHCVPVHKNWQVVPYPGGKPPRILLCVRRGNAKHVLRCLHQGRGQLPHVGGFQRRVSRYLPIDAPNFLPLPADLSVFPQHRCRHCVHPRAAALEGQAAHGA